MEKFKCIVRESFTEEETRGQRHKEGEEESHVSMWQRSIPGRGMGKCKGPEAGVCTEGRGHKQQ